MSIPLLLLPYEPYVVCTSYANFVMSLSLSPSLHGSQRRVSSTRHRVKLAKHVAAMPVALGARLVSSWHPWTLDHLTPPSLLCTAFVKICMVVISDENKQ